MRRKVSCPDCGLALIEMPDLFGSPRLAHPDQECVKITQRTPLPEFTVARCQGCKTWFPQRVKGYRRATCSTACERVVRRYNLIHRARPLWKKRGEAKKAKAVRAYWQKKAIELDNRWKVA